MAPKALIVFCAKRGSLRFAISYSTSPYLRQTLQKLGQNITVAGQFQAIFFTGYRVMGNNDLYQDIAYRQYRQEKTDYGEFLISERSRQIMLILGLTLASATIRIVEVFFELGGYAELLSKLPESSSPDRPRATEFHFFLVKE